MNGSRFRRTSLAGLTASVLVVVVILVSFESSAQDMFTYMPDLGMPWLAVPFGGEKAQALTRRYDVRWIPTLVVVDSRGRTVSVTGREEVAAKGAGAYDDWVAKGGG